MSKTLLKTVAGCSVAAAIIFLIIYLKTSNDICFSLLITFGTISYHLLMRFFIGWIVNCAMNNHANYENAWFREKPFEQKLYKKLNVKKWKDKMPTYAPEIFSMEKYSLDEIAQAMCQSEIVHETIAVFSFLPLAASIWFGAFFVFLITSILGACFDMVFVIMQRYNRPRILKILKRQRKKSVQ